MEPQERKSFWRKALGNLMPNKKVSTEPIEAVSTDINVDNGSLSSSELDSSNNVIPVYGHGFHNALYRITPEQDTFLNFLKFEQELKKIKELQGINSQALLLKDRKLDEAEATLKEIIGNQTAAETSERSLKEEQNELNLKKQQAERAKRDLSDKQKSLNPEYAWLPALFYLFAGVLFITGDISITKNITSIGFDMSEREGQLFAIGLALTVFLIKPLIDRLLEKPFQKSGYILSKLYRAFLVFIAIFGLVMLFFLGQFRAAAKSSMAELDQISKEQKKPGITNADIVNLQRKSAEISKAQADDWYGKWGMTLSTLVFAIGGAICLSVSFPSLTVLSNKYWFLPFRIKLLDKKIEEAEKEVLGLQKEIDNALNTSEKWKKEYDLLGIDSLKAEIALLKAERERLLSEFYDCQYNINESYYKDGYNRGEKYNLEGDLKYRIKNPLNPLDNSKKQEENDNTDPKDSRTYTRRPFVKLRKMIADNYNKNQKTQDETEFEIVT